MSHSGIDDEGAKELHAAMKSLLGEYPEGKLNDNDEGAIAIGVGHREGKVVIKFPKAVSWVGMTPQQAADVASSLIEHARAAGHLPFVLRVR